MSSVSRNCETSFEFFQIDLGIIGSKHPSPMVDEKNVVLLFLSREMPRKTTWIHHGFTNLGPTMNTPIKPSAAILPYPEPADALFADKPVESLMWPLGMPVEFAGQKVRDLPENCHIVCFPHDKTWFSRRPNVKAQLSVAFAEPTALHKPHYRKAIMMQWRFWRLFFINKDYTKYAKNARVFNLAGTAWITHSEKFDFSKSNDLSIIASAKKQLPGHRLRHEIVDHIHKNNINCGVFGRGYTAIDDKSQGLLPYRFSIVIENTQEPGYFTEKLIDCLLCKTVPIYWGDPNIDSVFDRRGMIICATKDDIVDALDTLSAERYAEMIEFIEVNYQQALAYSNAYERVAKTLVDELSAATS